MIMIPGLVNRNGIKAMGIRLVWIVHPNFAGDNPAILAVEKPGE